MDQPAYGASDRAGDEQEFRWASFTPDEARRLMHVKALYESGWFDDDRPAHDH